MIPTELGEILFFVSDWVTDAIGESSATCDECEPGEEPSGFFFRTNEGNINSYPSLSSLEGQPMDYFTTYSITGDSGGRMAFTIGDHATDVDYNHVRAFIQVLEAYPEIEEEPEESYDAQFKHEGAMVKNYATGELVPALPASYLASQLRAYRYGAFTDPDTYLVIRIFPYFEP
jgi:hypothetical protein